MKLISVEDSRVLSLVVIRMDEGQPYLPDLVAALVDRYSFLQSPGTIEEMQDAQSVFAMGKWRNTQIQELTAYSDGMIVRMRAPTSLGESLLDDLYAFLLEEFRIERVPSPPERRLYESGVVVQFDCDFARKLSFLDGVRDSMKSCLGSYGLGDHEYQPASLQLDVDMPPDSDGKPIPFTIVRRARTPYADNYWYSSAPLRTDDHIEILEALDS